MAVKNRRALNAWFWVEADTFRLTARKVKNLLYLSIMILIVLRDFVFYQSRIETNIYFRGNAYHSRISLHKR